MNNIHLIIEAIEQHEKYQNKNALELLRDNYNISDSDNDSEDDTYNSDISNNVLTVSMGVKNGQRKNAPPNSKDQSNIYIHLSDKTIKRGSGWHIWEDGGIWYHLGGNRNRKPTIYRLITDGRVGWSKINDQRKSQELYDFYGKY